MIIFFEEGKLGNQLFQYCGLKKYFPNDNLIFFGCKDLKELFSGVFVNFFLANKYNVIYSKNDESKSPASFEKFTFKLLKKTIFFLVRIKVLGKITHSDSNSNKFNINISRGFFSKLNVAYSIFFQHSDFINNVTAYPILKKKLLKQAKNWLKKKNIILYKQRLVFVHIRRSDYLFWPSSKFPAFLELTWYKRAMLKISKKIYKPIFVIMSDDLLYIQKEFKESDSLIISNNKAAVDLAIMQMCSHGILSPSTFAWWGGFFSRSKKIDKNNLHFIAPKFWVGHRIKKWFPKNFYTNWISYLK
jgi:hypothetical protein